MAYSYKGSISFGLVYIPITLHKSVKESEISFNMLDRQTMSRVQYKKTCVDCDDRIVKQQDIVKGFEYEEGKYVVFEEEDFEKIKTPKDKNITIEHFVDLGNIDPIYYDKPYYVQPTGAEKAYSLLLKAMQEENKAGIAKTVLGNKETLIAIRVKNGKMLLNTLYFDSEIQSNPVKDIDIQISKAELEMAKAIIKSMNSAFEPQKYKNEYNLKLQAAIQDKISGKQIIAPPDKNQRKVADLMDALKKTLEQTSAKAKPNNSKGKSSSTKKSTNNLPRSATAQKKTVQNNKKMTS